MGNFEFSSFEFDSTRKFSSFFESSRVLSVFEPKRDIFRVRNFDFRVFAFKISSFRVLGNFEFSSFGKFRVFEYWEISSFRVLGNFAFSRKFSSFFESSFECFWTQKIHFSSPKS